MEILFFGLIVLSILAFALVGFVQTVIWLTGGNRSKPTTPPAEPPRPQPIPPNQRRNFANRRTAALLTDYLHRKGQIDINDRRRIMAFLSRPDSELPDFQAATQVDAPPNPEGESASRPPVQEQPATSESVLVISDEPVGTEAPNAQAPQPKNTTEAPHHEGVPTAEVVVATRVESQESTTVPPKSRQTPPSSVAPWDQPDPPPRPPRKTLGEMLAVFMEERNMRWGELASGILIVLSAVGLIVSLREQLRNTIPYFSTLLFMLVTAAVQGAGIYTLKKWKLHNTSRGVLVIGLLLVPVNFLAACLLNGDPQDRAELTSPWLWGTILVGMTACGGMSYWSTRLLLRRGNLGVVLGLLGVGAGTLAINRLVSESSSMSQLVLAGLPAALGFLVGTLWIAGRQRTTRPFSGRAAGRVYLVGSLGLFAILTAMALLIVRSPEPLAGVVALLPWFSLVAIVLAWMGTLVQPLAPSNGASWLESQRSEYLIGRTCEVLGLICAAVGTLAALSRPSVFGVTCGVTGVALMGLGWRRQRPALMAWSSWVLSAGALMVLHLWNGRIEMQSWLEPSQLLPAILSAPSGLCLMACGMVSAVLLVVVPGRLAKGKRAWMERLVLQGARASVGLVALGCLVALVASLYTRAPWEVGVANALLGLAAVVAAVGTVWLTRRPVAGLPTSSRVLLANLSMVAVLIALAHGLLWDPLGVAWVQRWTGQSGNWPGLVHGLLVLSGAGLIAGIIGVLSLGGNTSASDVDESEGVATSLASWLWLMLVPVCLGCLPLISWLPGWASGLVLVVAMGCCLLGWMGRQSPTTWLGLKSREWAGAPLMVASGWLAATMVTEWGVRVGWFEVLGHGPHLVGLAWSLLIVGLVLILVRVAAAYAGHRGWLVTTWPVEVGGIVAALSLCLVCIGSPALQGVVYEIYNRHEPWLGSSGWSASLQQIASGSLIALLLVSILAIVLSLFQRPTLNRGMLAIGWVNLCAIGLATRFAETVSVASALRWSIPAAGLGLALIVWLGKPAVPVWSRIRQQFGQTGRSIWNASVQVSLVNLALSICSGVVLLISTLTIIQVLVQRAPLGGPTAESWFKSISVEVSYGLPVVLVVATFLVYAISESRRWLATCGSAVFQYMVLLALYCLVASPTEHVASRWFIGILQAVSIGMTAYGIGWYWFRGQIEGLREEVPQNAGKHLQVHTLVNGGLISGLAAVVLGNLLWRPTEAMGWVSSFGSLPGAIAWGLFLVLCYWVWKPQIRLSDSRLLSWGLAWSGTVAAALLAAAVEYYAGERSGELPHVGSTVTLLMTGLLLLLLQIPRVGYQWRSFVNRMTSGEPGERTPGWSEQHWNLEQRLKRALPMLVVAGLGLYLAWVGNEWLVQSWPLHLLTVLSWGGVLLLAGMVGRAVELGFAATLCMGLLWIAGHRSDPEQWFSNDRPDMINGIVGSVSLLSIVWLGWFYWLRRRPVASVTRAERFPRRQQRSVAWLPNVVMVLAVAWVLLASLAQVVIDSGLSRVSALAYPLGWIVVLCVAVLVGVNSLTHRWGRMRTLCLYLMMLCAPMLVVSGVLAWLGYWEDVWIALVLALVNAFVGTLGSLLVPKDRSNSNRSSRRSAFLRDVERSGLARSLKIQLPIYGLLLSALLFLAAFAGIFQVEEREFRFGLAAIPLLLAWFVATQADAHHRRWLQYLTIAMTVTGLVMVSWAPLSAEQMREPMQLLVRSVIVLAGATAVAGLVFPRWVRVSDAWYQSLRKSAVAIGGVSVIGLFLLIPTEYLNFVPEVGCGLSAAAISSVAAVGVAMIVALISLAVLEEQDPFALSLRGRMAYVYLAQAVAASLVGHLYFSAPWLFELGLKHYWPFILMAICFAGVGVGELLKRRELTVLATPLFNVATMLPVLVAVVSIVEGGSLDVVYDRSTVMLTIGLMYLMVSYLRKSVVSGAASVVFGNAALWLLFQKYPALAFMEHPQLWLIPPAVSVLVAAQLGRSHLTESQLTSIRYLASAVIYISSTSEIFIQGIGDSLWQPMVLAGLSVAGILAGMLLKIKSFLYLGSLFLLMSMVTMVSHAHQRFEHVWPWWAFGIGLGITILVVFGLFEKRKNEMKRLASELRQWEG